MHAEGSSWAAAYFPPFEERHKTSCTEKLIKPADSNEFLHRLKRNCSLAGR